MQEERVEAPMSTQKALFLMIAFFAIAIATYFLISPYEQCKREQMARFEGQNAVLAGGVPADMLVKNLCAKMTNW